MKKNILFALPMVVMTIAANAATPVEYVNTLMGTMSKHSLSTGNTYPAVCRPWGMNFWTPQTGKMGDGWQYVYTADKIRAFKQTHQPSPWINDYGQFAVMPTASKLQDYNEESRASWFSHKAEHAAPHYYKVYLADHDITAELTATSRAAIMRFTFPQSEDSKIIVDAFDKGSQVEIVNSTTIRGYTTKNNGGVPDNFKNYFVVVFSKPFIDAAIFIDGAVSHKNIVNGNHTMAAAGFHTKRNEQIIVKVASSFISMEQAVENLKEVGEKTFDAVLQESKQEWNDVLGVFQVEDDNVDNLRTFYSCLYRCVLFPRSFYEIDKEKNVVHYSPYNGRVERGYMFTDAGFWDVFRAQCPLLNLAYPAWSARMQEGLANAYKESGFLPEWASPGHRNCMVGNNSASVVMDAYKCSVSKRGEYAYDTQTLWQAVTHGANAVHPTIRSTGRLGHEYYNKLGYVPYDVKINESAARTLEYAYDDWCIFKFGQALGAPPQDVEVYARRAFNYKNLFDKTTLLMRGRMQDGTWQQPFNPLKWGDAFTEGNSWHYTWSVFHDVDGLIQLMGGTKAFIAMMDSVFAVPPLFDDSYYGGVIHEIREMQIMNMGNYAHGNQPIQHFIYLYNYAGQAWKAQQHAREAMTKLYSATPDGYCGDEDNGQTSAWYVLSALGFYPVCPGAGEYVLGSPLFKRASLRLSNGNYIRINADNNSVENVYISSMKFNGVDYAKNYLKYDDLLRGCVIDYAMSAVPNKHRGINADDAPYSFSREYKLK